MENNSAPQGRLVEHVEHGIHVIDSGYGRTRLAAIHLIVDSGRVAVVDTGNNASVPTVLAALAELGLAPDQVDWVLLTHIHLDHAGGAGSLMCAFPNARLAVHSRGSRHMADPSKLWDGTVAVYGAAQAFELYGRIVPIDVGRIVTVGDGDTLTLGERVLKVMDTPGHARHHVCYWDPVAHAWFTGDTFGLSYREFDVDGHAFIFPTTTPTHFDPAALHDSIDRLMAFDPQAMYLTHYSRVAGVPRLAADLHRLIDMLVAIAEAAQAARGDGVSRHVEILSGLEELVREEGARQGWGVDDDTALSLLRGDLELNAQGLGVWLDQRRAGAGGGNG